VVSTAAAGAAIPSSAAIPAAAAKFKNKFRFPFIGRVSGFATIATR